MPIDCKFPVHPVDQDSFHAIDKVVMRHAFTIHNELGRFCGERIYQDELAYRCAECGLDILREPIISVTHQDFRKQYFLDILVSEGAIYEMKAVKSLNGGHDVQVINYLLLAGLNHGKLVNMRPGSVEYRFISTHLTTEERHRYSLNLDGWNPSNPMDFRLYDLVVGLLDDWGAFLDKNLYREALIHFFGGVDQVIQPINIQVEGRIVGKQKVTLLADDTAFHLSAIKMHHETYQKHMTRLLNHSSLEKIHWINFQGAHIQFKTLEKK